MTFGFCIIDVTDVARFPQRNRWLLYATSSSAPSMWQLGHDTGTNLTHSLGAKHFWLQSTAHVNLFPHKVIQNTYFSLFSLDWLQNMFLLLLISPITSVHLNSPASTSVLKTWSFKCTERSFSIEGLLWVTANMADPTATVLMVFCERRLMRQILQ